MPSPQAASRRVLVFEPDGEGHAQEWLEHLIRHRDREMELSILAPAATCAALGRALPAMAVDRVDLIPMSPLEHRLCTFRPLALAAFARWWVARRHLAASRTDEGVFLSIDLQSLPLALGLGMGRARISGILFRPSVHYAALGPYTPSRSERLRDWRKGVLYRRMLRNSALSQVFSLDPFFAAYARDHYVQGKKVVALPDPALPAAEPMAATPGVQGFVPKGRVGFLLFGYLAERKGPLVLLDALARLPRSIASQVAVLLAGRVDPALKARIGQRRAELAACRPELWLRIEDRRLNEAELAALVQRSDVVLAPYQRFVGSSGVLLWAARAGRPVLAQEYGLVGRMTRDHGLGLTVDSSRPGELARKITHMVELGPAVFLDRLAAQRLVDTQTPQRFAELVLSV
jgi:glycosyltransferase involved in cell wall biosynthesis